MMRKRKFASSLLIMPALDAGILFMGYFG